MCIKIITHLRGIVIRKVTMLPHADAAVDADANDD